MTAKLKLIVHCWGDVFDCELVLNFDATMFKRCTPACYTFRKRRVLFESSLHLANPSQCRFDSCSFRGVRLTEAAPRGRVLIALRTAAHYLASLVR